MNVMTGLTACAVNEKLSYECLNTEKDIESCESQQSLARSNRYLTGCRSTLGGGCIRGANATGSIGQDCTTLVSTFVPMAPITPRFTLLHSPTAQRRRGHLSRWTVSNPILFAWIRTQRRRHSLHLLGRGIPNPTKVQALSLSLNGVCRATI
jgi:hypothetical protein